MAAIQGSSNAPSLLVPNICIRTQDNAPTGDPSLWNHPLYSNRLCLIMVFLSAPRRRLQKRAGGARREEPCLSGRVGRELGARGGRGDAGAEQRRRRRRALAPGRCRRCPAKDAGEPAGQTRGGSREGVEVRRAGRGRGGLTVAPGRLAPRRSRSC